MRLAEGRGVAVGGAGVGGTGVGGRGVAVTTTGVGWGDMEVEVGSAETPPPFVAPGVVPPATAWVEVAGGLPLAGSLQDVVIRASITNMVQTKVIFFFMVVSLAAVSFQPKANSIKRVAQSA